MKKIVLCLLAVMVFTVGTAAAAPPAGGAGFLDVNRIMDESPKVKALQAELNRRGQEIMQQLAAEKPQLTPEQYEQKQAEAYKDYEELKKTYELQIDGSIKQATAQVAKEKRLAVVLHNKGILAGGTDITDEVMRRMKLPLPGKH